MSMNATTQRDFTAFTIYPTDPAVCAAEGCALQVPADEAATFGVTEVMYATAMQIGRAFGRLTGVYHLADGTVQAVYTAADLSHTKWLLNQDGTFAALVD